PTSGKRLQEIPLPDLGEVLHPTWSPDGGQVAFAALINGFVDLFVVDVASQKVTRRTNDHYAELQPAGWPDGKSLVFVTDRFDTDLDSLRFGTYRLALYDLASGSVSELAHFDGGQHNHPHWGGARAPV